MENIRISVIVPIYNTEKFLRKCIESIVNQTLQEIEIILINDGSTDNSHNICLEYAEKYPEKIRYINNKNIGCSATRNLGIELAQGEYIAFVDSDDYIEKTMYEELWNEKEKNNSDIVVCGMTYINIIEKIEKISIPKIKNKHDYFSTQNRIANPINKIFNKKLIGDNEIKFPINTHYAEDLVFCFKAYLSTRNISSISKSFYNYILYGGNSIYNLDKRLGVFVSFDEIFKYLEEKKLKNNRNIMKKFYKLFNFYAIKSVFFTLLNTKQVPKEQYNKYNKIFYEELKKIEFLTLKSKFLIFYYRNLVFFIRKFHLYFFLKKLIYVLKKRINLNGI